LQYVSHGRSGRNTSHVIQYLLSGAAAVIAQCTISEELLVPD